jgi:lipoprotein NlpI
LPALAVRKSIAFVAANLLESAGVRPARLGLWILIFSISSIAHGQYRRFDWNPEPDYLARGQDLYRLGNVEAAIAEYTQAIKIHPDRPDPYDARGVAKVALGDYRGALADFNTVIQIAPHSGVGYYARATVQTLLGNYDAAIADLTQALTFKPKFWQEFSDRALAKEFKGDFSGAIADYIEAGRLNPHNAYPQISLWIIRSRRGQTSAANQELAAYIDRHIENSDDHWGTKVGEYLLGRTSESAFSANVGSYFASTKRGHQCESLYYVGLKYLFSGNKNGAADIFRKCLATNARTYTEYERAMVELKRLGKS